MLLGLGKQTQTVSSSLTEVPKVMGRSPEHRLRKKGRCREATVEDTLSLLSIQSSENNTSYQKTILWINAEHHLRDRKIIQPFCKP